MPDTAGTVVYDFEQFRDTLEQGTETHVIFGNDITMDMAGGITIPADKTEVIIDGNGFHYKDNGNDRTGLGVITNTIRYSGVNADTDYHLTFKNAEITGTNYYGILYATGAAYTNVYHTYENIIYKGPQIGFNRHGRITFRDCHIEVSTDYTSTAQEIAECNRVVLAGNTTIIHNPSGIFHMFPLVYNTSVPDSKHLVIEKDAAVTFTTPRYFFTNIDQFIIRENASLSGEVGSSLFTTGTAPIPFMMEDDSSFMLTAPSGFSNAATDRFGPITIGRNAKLSYVQTSRNGSISSLICNGDFTVLEGAEVYLEANYSGTANEILEMYSSGSTLTLENPRSFVLKHTDQRLFDFKNTVLNISARQINEWETTPDPADPGGLTNYPDHSWYRIPEQAGSSYSPYISVSGTATNSAFTMAQTNLTPEEQQVLPDYSLLLPRNQYVFAVGELPLFVNPIADDHYPIFGTTEPGAKLELNYTLNETPYTLHTTADSSGRFTVETETSLPLELLVSVLAVKDFLYAKEGRTVIPAGSIDMDIPPDPLIFKPTVIAETPAKLCGREIADWSIKVTDTRARSTPWYLEAVSSGILEGEEGNILPDALVYVENGRLYPISDTPTVVYHGSANGGETKITVVQWPADSGLLLQVTDTPFYIGEKYSSIISWTLKTGEA